MVLSVVADKQPKNACRLTAPISPGSSGGSVLNAKVKLLVVSFAGARALDAENLNFPTIQISQGLLVRSKLRNCCHMETSYLYLPRSILEGIAKYNLGDLLRG